MRQRSPALLAARIALRYVSVGRRSQLVSFMSALTIGGLALSVTILITVLSVMNGFEAELRVVPVPAPADGRGAVGDARGQVRLEFGREGPRESVRRELAREHDALFRGGPDLA